MPRQNNGKNQAKRQVLFIPRLTNSYAEANRRKQFVSVELCVLQLMYTSLYFTPSFLRQTLVQFSEMQDKSIALYMDSIIKLTGCSQSGPW